MDLFPKCSLLEDEKKHSKSLAPKYPGIGEIKRSWLIVIKLQLAWRSNKAQKGECSLKSFTVLFQSSSKRRSGMFSIQKDDECLR
jgi:hypothetical protein